MTSSPPSSDGDGSPAVRTKARCTSEACSHADDGRPHCDIMMCGNYLGDCPVH